MAIGIITRSNLNNLQRREIQDLAKKYGLKANEKSSTIIDRLIEKFPQGISSNSPAPPAKISAFKTQRKTSPKKQKVTPGSTAAEDAAVSFAIKAEALGSEDLGSDFDSENNESQEEGDDEDSQAENEDEDDTNSAIVSAASTERTRASPPPNEDNDSPCPDGPLRHMVDNMRDIDQEQKTAWETVNDGRKTVDALKKRIECLREVVCRESSFINRLTSFLGYYVENNNRFGGEIVEAADGDFVQSFSSDAAREKARLDYIENGGLGRQDNGWTYEEIWGQEMMFADDQAVLELTPRDIDEYLDGSVVYDPLVSAAEKAHYTLVESDLEESGLEPKQDTFTLGKASSVQRGKRKRASGDEDDNSDGHSSRRRRIEGDAPKVSFSAKGKQKMRPADFVHAESMKQKRLVIAIQQQHGLAALDMVSSQAAREIVLTLEPKLQRINRMDFDGSDLSALQANLQQGILAILIPDKTSRTIKAMDFGYLIDAAAPFLELCRGLKDGETPSERCRDISRAIQHLHALQQIRTIMRARDKMVNIIQQSTDDVLGLVYLFGLEHGLSDQEVRAIISATSA